MSNVAAETLLRQIIRAIDKLDKCPLCGGSSHDPDCLVRKSQKVINMQRSKGSE